MGFFAKNTKKEEKLPEVPNLPELPPMPDSQKLDLPFPKKTIQDNIKQSESAFLNEPPKKSFALPSFPVSPVGQKMNQNIIKETADFSPQYQQTPISDFGEVSMKPRAMEQDYSEKPQTREFSDWVNSQPLITPNSRKNFRETNFPRVKKTEPLFIKLDKFENTIATFNEVRMRISEIESLLKNIRAIKAREEKELSDWEKEIEMIKSRLDQIDSEIFKEI